jgi:two-component system NtrC family sensor kinase
VRIGVSGKIFLAYTVLLIAFAGSTSFTVLTIHSAREGVVANQAYLDLQGPVDGAWKTLNDLASSLGRNLRKDPNLALALRNARKNLDEALGVIDRYVAREPSSAHRAGFEANRSQLESFKADLDRLVAQLASVRMGAEDETHPEFESQLASLTRNLNRLRRPLRGQSALIAQRLTEDGDNARQVALLVGALGLLVAAFAVAFMWRTLRPLQVLRARAREIAGGDYGRRTGVRSLDEIGDLARELDVMAEAVEEREHRLIRSERLATVGKMAAQVTHEVRNPLASIGLYAELLGDELAEGSESRRLVASISSEVDRLTEITETYLRFARLPQPKLEREDVGSLVASVAEFARAELAQAHIELHLDLPAEPLEVPVDENQLRQALLNLIRNAREAMAEGGRLRIGVRREVDDTATITVTDSGPGIAAENLPKIFDPFFSTKAKGTGLGLALVQQIAVEHGGRVDVSSNDVSSEGQGTTFRLVLPVRAPTASSGVDGNGNNNDGKAAAPGAVVLRSGAQIAPEGT